MINVDYFFQAGMFDEKIFLYCEETCLGFRLKKRNYKVAVLNNIFFIHDHSVSISKSLNTEFKRKKTGWNSRMYLLKHYYHLNLLQLLFCSLTECISILESVIVHFFRYVK